MDTIEQCMGRFQFAYVLAGEETNDSFVAGGSNPLYRRRGRRRNALIGREVCERSVCLEYEGSQTLDAVQLLA